MNKYVDHFIKTMSGQTIRELKKEKKDIEKGEKRLKTVIGKENSMIRLLQVEFDKCHEYSENASIEDLTQKEQEEDAYTRILLLFPNNALTDSIGENLIKLVHDARHAEKNMMKTIKKHRKENKEEKDKKRSGEEEIEELILFKKEHHLMNKHAKDFKENCDVYSVTVNYLKNMEDKTAMEKHPEVHTIKRRFLLEKSTLKRIKENLNEIGEEFSKALEAAREIIKDDTILFKKIEDELHYLETGKHPEKEWKEPIYRGREDHGLLLEHEGYDYSK